MSTFFGPKIFVFLVGGERFQRDSKRLGWKLVPIDLIKIGCGHMFAKMHLEAPRGPKSVQKYGLAHLEELGPVTGPSSSRCLEVQNQPTTFRAYFSFSANFELRTSNVFAPGIVFKFQWSDWSDLDSSKNPEKFSSWWTRTDTSFWAKIC